MINFNEFDTEEKQRIIPDKEFKDFLRKHNVYDSYIINTIERGKDVKSFIESTRKISYISAAFTWNDTPQGHSYWNNINTQWHIFLSKISDL